MKRTKRWLAALLSAVLLLGLLPAAALADEAAPWAADAVDKLNEIYAESGFTFLADLTPMTAADANAFLAAMGSKETVAGDFTRGKACDILLKVYNIPVGNGAHAAIQYLYDKNVISGYKGDAVNLGENDPIDKASFAVLTYRVLNFVGGGDGYSENIMQDNVPLSGDEFFCWMYLDVRNCMSINPDLSGDLPRDNRDAPGTAISYATWNKWRSRLLSPKKVDADGNIVVKEGGLELRVNIPEWPENGPAPDDFNGRTNLEAAVHMVKTYFTTDFNNKQIFYDVSLGSWHYDGVMYLLNKGYVVGIGNGNFDLRVAPRAEFAMLLAIVDPDFDYETETGLDLFTYAKTYVAEKGYMKGPGADEPDYWNRPVTREEAVYAAIKCFAASGELGAANTDILDRFEDRDDITKDAEFDYAKAMAFAVSHGLINGTSASTLAPHVEVTRPEMGVFIYRVLIGLDSSKMHDYEESVKAVLPDAAMPEGETK